MTIWDNSTFDQRATDIANAFCAGENQNGSSLTDLVEKDARDASLNPEQIRRLARMSNVKTFGVKFEGMKTAGAEDRNVEFAVADETEIIRRLQSAAGESMKTASDGSSYPDLPDSFRDLRRPAAPDEPMTKTAETQEAVLMGHVRPDMELIKLYKLAEEVEIRVKQATESWRDSMGEVFAAMRKTTWSDAAAIELEKDAIALYGVNVLPEINVLRYSRTSPQLEFGAEKIAQLQEHLVGTEGPLTRALKTASEARQQFYDLEKTRDLIQTRTRYFSEQLRGTK